MNQSASNSYSSSNLYFPFTDIRTTFKDVSKYKIAVNAIESVVFAKMVDNSPTKLPLTLAETKTFAKQQVMKRIQALTTQLTAEPTNQDVATELGALRTLMYTAKGKESDKVFESVWKDLYPNFKFKSGEGSADSSGNLEAEMDSDKFIPDEEKGINEHTIQSDERDNESKMSDNVKNFLSFMYYTDKDGNVEKINPRYVYLECLRTLTGLITGDPNTDLLDQIKARAKYNGINVNSSTRGAAVIANIKNLILKAEGTIYVDGSAVIDLPRTSRFYNDNIFATAKVDLSGINAETIAGKSDVLLIGRKHGESTPNFIKRLAAETGLHPTTVIAYFKQHQAQETLREVMTVFLSQREAMPLIAEEYRDGPLGQQIMVLRYFKAQFYGKERVIANDVQEAIKANWAAIEPKTWNHALGMPKVSQRIDIILKALGIEKDIREYEDFNNTNVWDTLMGFKQRVELLKNSKGGYDLLENQDVDDSDLKYKDLAWQLTQEASMINKLTSLLSKNTSGSRTSKYKSADGKTKYVFHNSSQALDTVARLIGVTGEGSMIDGYSATSNDARMAGKTASEIRKFNGTPEHLRDNWGSKNIFVSGINTLFNLVDHDGMRVQNKEEFAKSYADENESESLQRQFAYGFLNYIRSNTSNIDTKLKYIQYFYTLSNRPRMMGCEVNVLDAKGIQSAAHAALDQLLAQPATAKIKSYSRYKTVNMSLMGDAITEIVGGRNAESYEKLTASPELRQQVVDVFSTKMKERARVLAQKLVDEQVYIGDNSGEVARLMKAKKRGYMDAETSVLASQIGSNKWDKNIGYTVEDVLPLVEAWYANNYLNSYFMNQVVVGNYNYFKNAVDIVKRMSGVFAPGIRGLSTVDGAFFAKQKFKVVVGADPKMLSTELSSVFKGTGTEAAAQADDEGGGFDMADAQGLMTPRRAADLLAGLGQSYKRGAVFKAAHYEIVDRPGIGYTPVMIKYSAVILSDELCAAHPKLLAIRQRMENDGVDEVLFDSANKVGQPTEDRPMPKHDAELSQWTNTVFHPNSVITLSNENYRLQLNPNHITVSEEGQVGKNSSPTQLTYFVNLMNQVDRDNGRTEAADFNQAAATNIYNAFADLYKHELAKMDDSIDVAGRIKKSAVMSTLQGAGNERALELLKEVDYNLPTLTDKVLVQMMNLFAKRTVRTKFEGGKFVLQSSYGFEMIKTYSPEYHLLSENKKAAHDAVWSDYGNSERSKMGKSTRRLEYKTDENGRLYAEVLIDKSYAEQIGIGDFLLPDAMAYRIPSTELHSSIAIKVAGFYDSKGSNVIVAPAELVKHHGSDFDVDALYVMNREYHTITRPDGSEQTIPVGYVDNGSGKWEADDSEIRQYLLDLKEGFSDTDHGGWYQQEYNEVYEKLLRNKIVENFIDIISNPLNLQRMLEPISTQPITDVIKKLEIPTKEDLDLSDVLDNLKMFKSNFQGLKLTGAFANAVKALAYMVKAGKPNDKNISIDEYDKLEKKIRNDDKLKMMYNNFQYLGSYKQFIDFVIAVTYYKIDFWNEKFNKEEAFKKFIKDFGIDKPKYPQLQKIHVNNRSLKIIIGGQVFNKFTETFEDGEHNIWQVLNALKNAAINNGRDQLLSKINATDVTGSVYVAAIALGISFMNIVIFMLQPIVLILSKSNGKIEILKSTLLKTYNESIDSNLFICTTFQELVTLSNSAPNLKIEEMKELVNKDLLILENTELLRQVKLLESLENLMQIGKDISLFSSALSILKDFPVTYQDIQKKANVWHWLGVVNEYGDFVTNPKLSFNIDRLFNVQPNIREAYNAFFTAKRIMESSIIKHFPAMSIFVNECIAFLNLKKISTEELKTETMAYLISTIYSEQNKAEFPLEYTYHRHKRVVTGKTAWSHRFASSLEPLIQWNKKLNKDEGSAFLRAISVVEKYGLKSIEFSGSSNDTYLDNLELQEGFENLFVEYNENEEDDSYYDRVEHLKKDFVRYAVLNYGLKFGVKNYSNVIPVSYLQEVDKYLLKLDVIIRNTSHDGVKVLSGELVNMKEHFLLQLILNKAEKLPLIPSQNVDAVPTVGKTIKIQSSYLGNIKIVPALNGYENGYYYNRKYSNPFENGRRKYDENIFPKFVRSPDNIVFLRLNDIDCDFIYYQKVGKKNLLGGYEAPAEVFANHYKIETYFGKGVIPISVDDVNAEIFQIQNDYVNIGSKIILYNHNNETREYGRFGVVESINMDLRNSEIKHIRVRNIMD